MTGDPTDSEDDTDSGTGGEYRYHVGGELVPASEATVNVRDRGFQYGDAAFETVRAYAGRLFEWARHERRLRNTCDLIGMADAVPDDLRERVRETLAANDLSEAYVRISVTRGIQPGKLTPAPEVDPTVVVLVDDLPRGGVDGEPVWDSTATVQTVKTRRIPGEAVPPEAKSHNYLNGIVARLELRRAAGDGDPADEALVRDLEGRVVEGTTSNVFFVEDGTLRTPSAQLDLLPGVTREVVLGLAREEAIPVETGEYGVERVREADEAFLTNTTGEVWPVATVDGVEVGGGPVTDLLARLFDERVERRHYRDDEG